MTRKKVINELNLNKDQEFERLVGHLKVEGVVTKLVVEPELPVESPPWEVEKKEELVLEPEQLEEKIRSVELPKKIENPVSLGGIQLIRQVGNMKPGHQAPIVRIDGGGRVYFMNGDVETYFDPSEQGRLFIIFNEK